VNLEEKRAEARILKDRDEVDPLARWKYTSVVKATMQEYKAKRGNKSLSDFTTN
jgi:hypothetical protein